MVGALIPPAAIWFLGEHLRRDMEKKEKANEVLKRGMYADIKGAESVSRAAAEAQPDKRARTLLLAELAQEQIVDLRREISSITSRVGEVERSRTSTAETHMTAVRVFNMTQQFNKPRRREVKVESQGDKQTAPEPAPAPAPAPESAPASTYSAPPPSVANSGAQMMPNATKPEPAPAPSSWLQWASRFRP